MTMIAPAKSASLRKGLPDRDHLAISEGREAEPLGWLAGKVMRSSLSLGHVLRTNETSILAGSRYLDSHRCQFA